MGILQEVMKSLVQLINDKFEKLSLILSINHSINLNTHLLI